MTAPLMLLIFFTPLFFFQTAEGASAFHGRSGEISVHLLSCAEGPVQLMDIYEAETAMGWSGKRQRPVLEILEGLTPSPAGERLRFWLEAEEFRQKILVKTHPLEQQVLYFPVDCQISYYVLVDKKRLKPEAGPDYLGELPPEMVEQIHHRWAVARMLKELTLREEDGFVRYITGYMQSGDFDRATRDEWRGLLTGLGVAE